MKPMHISLLGQPRIIPSDSTRPVKLTRSCLSLFAYLLMQPGQSISRERILDTFWGEHSEPRARSCLNSALWRLRNMLGATDSSATATEYVLSMEDGQVSFNWQCAYWYDVEEFEQVAAVVSIPSAEMTEVHIRSLNDACNFYAGELLEGFYDDWALRERERLRRLYLVSLSHLMEYYSRRGEYERSLSYGHQLLDLDPLREEVHRAIIRLYMQIGQRAKAVQQFERCRKVLEDELGVEPMEETLLLYGQICGATGGVPTNSEPPPIDYQQALRELKLARKRVDELSTQIHRTIYLLEQCRNSSNPNSSSPS
jgi:DNA-binding SARP family transcriptional activator